MNMPLRFVGLLFAIFALAGAGRGDVLHFVGGHTMEGRVERVEGGYRIETAAGKAVIPAHRITRVEKKLTPAEEYAVRRDMIGPDDFNGHMVLGKWCRQNGMPDEAKWHFAMAVAIRPDDTAARIEAGWIMHDGVWLRHDDVMRLRGFERFQGKWVPADEALRLSLERKEKRERHRVYEDAWRLIRETARRNDGKPTAADADALLEMGPYVFEPVERAAKDVAIGTRELALLVLARMPGEESLHLLMRRLMIEPSGRLRRKIGGMLREREERDWILERLLDTAVNHSSRRVRKRAVTAMRGIGDVRVIEALVPLAAFSLVPPKADDGVKILSGEAEAVTSPTANDPVYTACEALHALTGEPFGPNPQAWREWWDAHRDTFRLGTGEVESGDSESDDSEEADESLRDL